MSIEEFWKKINLKELEIPQVVKNRVNSIDVREGRLNVETASVFYREAIPQQELPPSDINLLLLHGAAFSSKTWLDLGTIKLVAAMGYRTVAVDMPGYGNTPSISITDRAAFLRQLIKSFGLKNPVIVSPSLSGYYSLPYLLQYSNEMAGYVPVAPVGIDVLEQCPPCIDSNWKKYIYEPLRDFLHAPLPDLSNIKTPTLVVFGEKDRSRSSALLSLLPCSQCTEIPNGHHPAYLDDPDLWHKLIYNFLYCLENKKFLFMNLEAQIIWHCS